MSSEMGNLPEIPTVKTIQTSNQKKIEQLCDRVDDSIFISLLLIRHLAQEDPSSTYFTEGDTSQIGSHLWEIVRTGEEGNYISSITKALTLVGSLFPFIHKLIVQNEKQTTEDDALKQLIDLLSDISSNDLACAVIYENYLQKKIPARQTSSFGDFNTPRDIAQCLALLLDPSQNTAYDPYCRSGVLLSAVQTYSGHSLKLYGQSQDEESYLLTQIYLILNGLYVDLGKTTANTLLDDQHKEKKFDSIIANPPFNSANWFNDNNIFYDERWCFGVPPRSNANFAWLQHIINHMDRNGRAAVILPNGALTTRTYSEASIRESIIENDLVEAIISLPPGLFYSAKIPCCIWLLTNTDNRSGDILFIDTSHMKPAIKNTITAEHMKQLDGLIKKYRQGTLHTCTDWYGTASLKTIRQNDFLLSPNLYTAVSRPEPSKIRKEYEKLTQIIDKLSALSIDETILESIMSWKYLDVAKSWEKAALLQIYSVFGGLTKNRSFFGRGYPLLDVKTVIHSPYMPHHFSANVEVTEEEKIKYNIKYGDVLLNRTSETIAQLACCCVALEDQNAVYSGFIKRLRPWDQHILDPLYASCYFQSEIYRWEVENVSTVYTTYASINNRKLSKIAVYFPDVETQKKIGGTIYKIYQFQKQCSDGIQNDLLKEFSRLLIQQYITYPILRIQNKDGDYQCR